MGHENLMKTRFLTFGDINAFFALLVDNVVNLVVLTGILVQGFGMPQEFVVSKMLCGTALGVMLGDIAYAVMAMRLNKDATAMPLGLDTPSTIGVAVAVIGPAYKASSDPYVAWGVGMATLVTMGVVKTVLAFFGDMVARILPTAALLGPLAGVGLALLGVFPAQKVFSEPIVGIVCLGIILYTLVAKIKFPFRLPGVLVAICIGVFLHFLLQGEGASHLDVGALAGFSLPTLEARLIWDSFGRAVPYLPIAIPFGLLTIVGGINVTESARCAGDNYRTRDILLVEALSTLVAGFLGGVAQSTPYIGHPAYKAMGARSGYAWLVGLCVGLGGIFGVLGYVVTFIPEVVVAPILLFVGLEIAVQAFSVVEKRHFPAVAFSIVPVLAYLVTTYTGRLIVDPSTMDAHLRLEVETIAIVGRNFILTSLLWGALMVFLIERKIIASVTTLIVLAVFSLFGVIHSVDPQGAVTLPWLVESNIPVQIAVGYFGFALLVLLLFLVSDKARG